jgi:hypothetical protein
MPVDDQRIERALEASAPTVDTGRVLERVATKRARRRTARRIEGGVLALVLVAVIGLTAVLTTRDDGSSPQIAAPGAALSARVVSGGDAVDGDAGRLERPTPIDLDADPGQLRSPLVVGSAWLSFASYDRSESVPALSHVVRVDGQHVVDVVDFKARVISITEGEGVRWALTQNLRATGGTAPDTFLKRIAADGSTTSTQLPVDSVPVGPVAAVGGAVWVPTRAGLVQFDTNGGLVRSIALGAADTRSVAAIGKSAWVTDGAVGLRRLDPSTGATSDTRGVGSLPLLSAAGDLLNGWVLEGTSRLTLLGPDLRATGGVTLPQGFTGSTVTVGAGRVWVTGTVGGAPAIVLLDGDRVLATVVLRNSRDAAMVWSARQTVTVLSNGGLVSFPVR